MTANPLGGLEDRPFEEAVERAEQLFGGRGYPRAETFRRAWRAGRIDESILEKQLAAHGYTDAPDSLLDRMEAADDEMQSADATSEAPLDRLITKWLTVFLDEGRAEWSMPDREKGWYRAFRLVARYDADIPNAGEIANWPEDPIEALGDVLEAHPDDRWRAILEHHLSALPGWAGFIKRRHDQGGDWQSEVPITLVDYLAVRLKLATHLDLEVAPRETTGDAPEAIPLDDETRQLAEVWLEAWEMTYRRDLVESLEEASATSSRDDETGARPDAQLVFCIDTRSEIIRRHVEDTGNYETHGYAGFFGIPMRHQGYGRDVTVDACPPILEPEHRIEDRPDSAREHRRGERDRWEALLEAGHNLLEELKSNAATAFNFVESVGGGYGASLAMRTLLPSTVYNLVDDVETRVPDDHEFCTPTIDRREAEDQDLPLGLTLEEQVEYAAAAFELMGWETFAPVVAFVGHAAQTANNPFDSSLDCGACAANPGGPSARVLAAICNDDDVRAELRERGIEIPEETLFVAGEHNTTTDEITLYDEEVPERHRERLEQLKEDLEEARAGSTAERAESMGVEVDDGIRETERRAADWAETRPEWGLAGNASFVVGPRRWTEDLDLGGRAFLHSYDWSADANGDALEAIMVGPMVVTQWINTQYYFATVDNAVYGSGSKITQNPVGNIGVFQGNGGDLMMGLPLQSLMAADGVPYHQPIRSATVVQAPVERVHAILESHENLVTLLDHEWLALTVVDPTRGHEAFDYDGELTWVAHDSGEPLSLEASEPMRVPTGT